MQRGSYKGGSPFERFLKSLDDSGQTELMKKLKNPEERSKTFQNKKRDVELELKVQRCYVKLTENMLLGSTFVLELFEKEGILDGDDVFELRKLPPTEQARTFLSILECRRHQENSPYYLLMEALQKDHDFLAKAIEDITITDEDIHEYESKLISTKSFITFY